MLRPYFLESQRSRLLWATKRSARFARPMRKVGRGKFLASSEAWGIWKSLRTARRQHRSRGQARDTKSAFFWARLQRQAKALKTLTTQGLAFTNFLVWDEPNVPSQPSISGSARVPGAL